MNASESIRIARKQLLNMEGGMISSAEICLKDAVEQYDAGNFDAAKMWAAKSLRYSVGVFHADYKRVA